MAWCPQSIAFSCDCKVKQHFLLALLISVDLSAPHSLLGHRENRDCLLFSILEPLLHFAKERVPLQALGMVTAICLGVHSLAWSAYLPSCGASNSNHVKKIWIKLAYPPVRSRIKGQTLWPPCLFATRQKGITECFRHPREILDVESHFGHCASSCCWQELIKPSSHGFIMVHSWTCRARDCLSCWTCIQRVGWCWPTAAIGTTKSTQAAPGLTSSVQLRQ